MGKQNGTAKAGSGGAADAHGSWVLVDEAPAPKPMDEKDHKLAALLFGKDRAEKLKKSSTKKEPAAH